MIETKKKIEFWNYLTTERNQARPKGITIQRLAVIKPLALASDLWLEVIDNHGAENLSAQEFYQTADVHSVKSRAAFWEAVRCLIGQANKQNNTLREDRTVHPYANNGKNDTAGKNRNFRERRRKRF